MSLSIVFSDPLQAGSGSITTEVPDPGVFAASVRRSYLLIASPDSLRILASIGHCCD